MLKHNFIHICTYICYCLAITIYSNGCVVASSSMSTTNDWERKCLATIIKGESFTEITTALVYVHFPKNCLLMYFKFLNGVARRYCEIPLWCCIWSQKKLHLIRAFDLLCFSFCYGFSLHLFRINTNSILNQKKIPVDWIS